MLSQLLRECMTKPRTRGSMSGRDDRAGRQQVGGRWADRSGCSVMKGVRPSGGRLRCLGHNSLLRKSSVHHFTSGDCPHAATPAGAGHCCQVVAVRPADRLRSRPADLRAGHSGTISGVKANCFTGESRPSCSGKGCRGKARSSPARFQATRRAGRVSDSSRRTSSAGHRTHAAYLVIQWRGRARTAGGPCEGDHAADSLAPSLPRAIGRAHQPRRRQPHPTSRRALRFIVSRDELPCALTDTVLNCHRSWRRGPTQHACRV